MKYDMVPLPTSITNKIVKAHVLQSTRADLSASQCVIRCWDPPDSLPSCNSLKIARFLSASVNCFVVEGKSSNTKYAMIEVKTVAAPSMINSLWEHGG